MGYVLGFDIGGLNALLSLQNAMTQTSSLLKDKL